MIKLENVLYRAKAHTTAVATAMLQSEPADLNKPEGAVT
jgi:hypothetical protein